DNKRFLRIIVGTFEARCPMPDVDMSTFLPLAIWKPVGDAVGLLKGVVEKSSNIISTIVLLLLSPQAPSGGNTALTLGPAMHMLAATEVGAVTLVFTNPLWVIKTRLCLQYDAADNKTVKYNGMLHGLAHIYKEDGIRVLYSRSCSLFGKLMRLMKRSASFTIVLITHISCQVFLEANN
ncbi:hypothetical protein GQX74_005989, partial [Glossina fuscipes]